MIIALTTANGRSTVWSQHSPQQMACPLYDHSPHHSKWQVHCMIIALTKANGRSTYDHSPHHSKWQVHCMIIGPLYDHSPYHSKWQVHCMITALTTANGMSTVWSQPSPQQSAVSLQAHSPDPDSPFPVAKPLFLARLILTLDCKENSSFDALLTLRRRIKSHLLFAGIIRSSPFSLR